MPQSSEWNGSLVEVRGQTRAVSTPKRGGTGKAVMQDWAKQLPERWNGELVWNRAMSRHCTLQVGGPARVIAIPGSTEELAALMAVLGKLQVAWHVIGRGSNLLVPDSGYNGVIVLLGRKFSAMSASPSGNFGGVTVSAEAGCSLMKLVSWCVDQGHAGLEFAAGIPGSVGGAVAMNAGAWGAEICERIGSVTFVDQTGRIVQKGREELSFSYRHLATDGMVVTRADFLLQNGDRLEMKEKCSQLSLKRKARQPQGVASAGSFFKNPAGGPAAGKLIEDAGLKGMQIGGAQVSPVHANFLVNTGGATTQNFLDLMHCVQEKVFEWCGIWLEPEVQILTVGS